MFPKLQMICVYLCSIHCTVFVFSIVQLFQLLLINANPRQPPLSVLVSPCLYSEYAAFSVLKLPGQRQGVKVQSDLRLRVGIALKDHADIWEVYCRFANSKKLWTLKIICANLCQILWKDFSAWEDKAPSTLKVAQVHCQFINLASEVCKAFKFP